MASSARSEAMRLAISCGAAASLLLHREHGGGERCRQLAARCGARSRRACRRRAPAGAATTPRARPGRACRRCASARGRRRESRTAASDQPSALRAPAISSAPSGEPCDDALPALVGAPKPIVVRQAIITGRSDVCALASAGGNRLGIVAVDAARLPAGGFEPLHLIDRVGERQRPVDGDAVVVEQHDQLVQLEMAGERDRLLADAFHQVAVGGEHIGAMVDDVVAEHRREMRFGDRHADGVGEALAERPGRGLDAGRVAVFRMTRRQRAELAEALDLIDRHRLVAEEMQQRVDQHRAVAGRQHEAVAVGPGRIGRIEFQEAREQHGRDVGRAHRQSGMAGLRLFDGIHGERADRVRHAVVLGARHC